MSDGVMSLYVRDYLLQQQQQKEQPQQLQAEEEEQQHSRRNSSCSSGRRRNSRNSSSSSSIRGEALEKSCDAEARNQQTVPGYFSKPATRFRQSHIRVRTNNPMSQNHAHVQGFRHV